jgi:hypothetical protein
VASPLLGALIAVSGVIGTIIFSNIRERTRQEHERQLAKDRQKHERLLKDAELDDARKARHRDERREAYIAYMSVCDRLHGGDHSQEARVQLRRTVALVELASTSEAVKDSVRELTNHLLIRVERGETEAVSTRDEAAYRVLLGRFTKAMQEDLGITPTAIQDRE